MGVNTKQPVDYSAFSLQNPKKVIASSFFIILVVLSLLLLWSEMSNAIDNLIKGQNEQIACICVEKPILSRNFLVVWRARS